MKKAYTIVIERDGIATIFEDKDLLRSEFYDNIIDMLICGKHAQRQREYVDDLEALVSGCEWVFPKERKDVYSSGTCVYFIQCETEPELIKIGMTQNLSQRSKGLASSMGSDVKVIAYAKTTEYKYLEQALHYHFRYCNEHGEWFQERDIWKFLSDVSSR